MGYHARICKIEILSNYIICKKKMFYKIILWFMSFSINTDRGRAQYIIETAVVFKIVGCALSWLNVIKLVIILRALNCDK